MTRSDLLRAIVITTSRIAWYWCGRRHAFIWRGPGNDDDCAVGRAG